MTLSKKEAQNLINEITKEATPFTGTVSPAKHAPAVGGHDGIHYSKLASVKAMQEAIQDLAQAAAPQRLGTKQQFNKFLSSQNEAIDQEKAETDNEGSSIQMNLNIVLKQLKNVGAQDPAKWADGAWGPNTQNALDYILSFAEAFLNVSERFGAGAEKQGYTHIEFNREDLARMTQLVLSVKNIKAVDNKTKDEVAKQLTPLIVKLNSHYNYYYRTAIQNPSFSSYLKRDMSLQEAPAVKDQRRLSPELLKRYLEKGDTLILHQVKTPKGTVDIPLSYLGNLGNFSQFAREKLGYRPDELNQKALADLLSSIMKSVDDYFATPGEGSSSTDTRQK